MVATILSAFTVADIRKKIAFTALMLALYRLGAHIPVPGVNVQAVRDIQEQFGRTHTQPVNLRDLEARFDDGAEVTPDALRERRLATRKGIPVKVLGQGDISKKLTVHAHAFSETARRKIEEAGGTCQIIE